MADNIKDYLNSIARYPLLTMQQEIQLGRRVARWRELKDTGKPLTIDEQREMRSGERARQRFIQSNLQLVVYIARKYDKRSNKTLEMMDLIQEGNIGLARAVDMFDPARGYKFSTYAYWWIRQGITRALMLADPVIKLPLKLHETLYRLNRVAQQMSHTLGRSPKLSEIASAMDIPAERLSMMLKQSYRVTSLDQRIGDEDTNCIADLIADQTYTEDDDNLKQSINEMLSYFDEYLDPMTQQIIKSRMMSRPVPWSELNETTGITISQMQNLERRGMRRLRMLMSNPLDGTPLGTKH